MKKIDRRSFLKLMGIGGTVLTAGALSACGGSTASSAAAASQSTASASGTAAHEPVTLEFLSGSQALVDWFESYFPDLVSGKNEYNITVEIEYQQDATQILQTKAAANEIPDMLCVGLPSEMIEQGKFEDLSEGDWWNDTLDSARELSTDVKSGKIYTAPLGSGAVGIFYNTDIMTALGAQAPQTWADYKTLLAQVKEKYPDVTPMYIGGKDSWSLGHIMEYTLMGKAKAELGYLEYETALAADDLDKLGWNTDENGILSIFGADMMEMYKDGLINNNAVTATTDDLAEQFVNGKVAFASQGMWALSAMQDKNPDFKSIGFMAYPAMDGEKAIVGGPLEGSVAISAGSAPEKIEAAKTVLALMTAPEANKSYCEATATIPVRTTVDANWSFLKDTVKDVLENNTVVAFSQNLPGAFSGDENGRLVQNIFVGKYATAQDFAKDYLDMWNSAYDAAKQ
ncbi:MAG: ABC transporter substrate-binding protein [Faecalibacterium sp.]|jgi:raffinose/stachyose/melibiose transport system substrate-binding protein|nr:ABC transporter substrate-binding protein [Faecalibacterium sp.]